MALGFQKCSSEYLNSVSLSAVEHAIPFDSTQANDIEQCIFRLFMTVLFQSDHVCCFSGNETVTKLGMVWNGMMKVVVPMGRNRIRQNQSMNHFDLDSGGLIITPRHVSSIQRRLFHTRIQQGCRSFRVPASSRSPNAL